MYQHLLFRLAYVLYMFEMLLEKFTSCKLFVMYDIACSLQKHLKVSIMVQLIVVEHLYRIHIQ